MAAIIQIHADEIRRLQEGVEAKFLSLNPHVSALRKNSFKGSYTELAEHMRETLKRPDLPMSEGLLRKLFYDAVDKSSKTLLPEMSFNGGFLDACYRYMTDGEQNRILYLRAAAPATSTVPPPQAPNSNTPTPSNTKTNPRRRALLIGLIGVPILAALTWLTLQFFPGEPELPPADILVSKFVGEKADKGNVSDGDVKIGWYLKTEMDRYLPTRMAEKVVGSEEEALALGSAQDVKFVVWGEILRKSETSITLFTKFQILEMPEVVEARDSAVLAKMDDFKRETFAIGAREQAEFQKAYSEEWACISLFAVGLAHYLEAEYAEAEGFFARGLENCPDKEGEIGAYLYHYYLGNCAYQKGKYGNAVERFHAALALQPEDAHTLGNLGSAYAQWGLQDSAALYFRKALLRQPGFDWVQRNLAALESAKKSPLSPHSETPSGNTSNATTSNTSSDSLSDSLAATPSDFATQASIITPSTIRDDPDECMPALPVSALSPDKIRTRLLTFISGLEKQIQSADRLPSQKRCLDKLAVARKKLARHDFHRALPSVWSLFYKADAQSARQARKGHELECLPDGAASGERTPDKELEHISEAVIRFYLVEGDKQAAEKRYEAARELYHKAVQVSTFFETNSGKENFHSDIYEKPNTSDRLKSTAFLKTGYTYLDQGKIELFCKHARWADFPGSVPYGMNKTYLLEYNLRNMNNVR
ncbi:MAG: tetratricopeptide repeat protein, partial [Bacteroidota bacterium]